MRRVVPLTVALIGGWLSMPALAVDATQLLERLGKAEHRQSFSGTFVYGVAGGLSAHEVWHQAGNGEVRERFLRLDGEPAEVVRVAGEIRCATDDAAMRVANDSGWRAGMLDLGRLHEGYEIRSLDGSRVAGRHTDGVALVPRDQHRYGLELYLDQQTGLPLKVLLLGDGGQVLERYQFTRFQPGAVDEKALAAEGACRTVPALGPSLATSGRWRADWVPVGFSLLDSGARSVADGQATAQWLTYGDGLAKFTAFIEPVTGAVPNDERTQLGPTSVVSKRIPAPSGDVMVTVVGEVPLGTAERIALSLRSTAEQGQ